MTNRRLGKMAGKPQLSESSLACDPLIASQSCRLRITFKHVRLSRRNCAPRLAEVNPVDHKAAQCRHLTHPTCAPSSSLLLCSHHFRFRLALKPPRATQEFKLHSSCHSQEFVLVLYNQQPDVDHMVHLCGSRRRSAPIKPGE